MTDLERLNYLKLALRVVGVIAIFGIYPLTVLWPSGWSWSSGRSEYLEMIIAIYATLGVFLLVAVQSILNPMHIHHLYGDVPALFIIAAVLAFLSPAAFRLPFVRNAP